jgi:hypothetical protein
VPTAAPPRAPSDSDAVPEVDIDRVLLPLDAAAGMMANEPAATAAMASETSVRLCN